ncbi:MAG: serine hydrolase domain-containing protein [Bacteroidota bacterium]
MITILFGGCVQTTVNPIDEEIQAIENGLQTAISIKTDSSDTYSILDRMAYYHVPGISISVVKDGEIRWSKGYGLANTIDSIEVNTNTLFQAGSISKPISALAPLKLMEEGKLGLDVDVNQYLKDWKIEDNKLTNESKVTMRRLLTHTAGTTVYGFPGYSQSDTLPTLEQVLNGEGNSQKVVVSSMPGSGWSYSGGGYTTMQKVIEDVSEISFEAYMEENFFKPLDMSNTTFRHLDPKNDRHKASAAYDSNGELIKGYWHNYPEQAAAGLWTTPEDLAKYCVEIQQILNGKQNGILKRTTVEAMLTKHLNDWGLGPQLVWSGDSLRFQHNGKTVGFATDMIAFAHQGNAVIVFANGDDGRLLINEILRSVSNYYGWNIISSKEVEVVNLKSTQLDSLVGKYSFDPTSSEPMFEISSDGIHLILDARERGEFEFLALDSMNFIDLKTGRELFFDLSGEQIQLVWNKEDKFYKID